MNLLQYIYQKMGILNIGIIILLLSVAVSACRVKDDKSHSDFGQAVFVIKPIVFDTDTIFLKRRTYVGVNGINVVALSLDGDEDIEAESDYILSNSGVFYNADSDSLRIRYTGTISAPKNWTPRIGVAFNRIDNSAYSDKYDDGNNKWQEFK
jgi:hypothetical protein